MSWSSSEIKKLPVSERLEKCPHFLQQLVDLASRELDVKKVILFGSRARGDHREKSDYDIALTINPKFDSKWPHFMANIQENLQTLYSLDIVNLDKVDKNFHNKILEQGVIIYEKI